MMMFRVKTSFLCLAVISSYVKHIHADHGHKADAHPIIKNLRSTSAVATSSMSKKLTDHQEEGINLGGERPGTEDKMVYEGNWGLWKGWKGVMEGGYYACGAEMRFEDPGNGDDTAANGLKLRYCHHEDWTTQRTHTIENGLWGSWKGMQMCPFGSYVDGAQIRYEDSQGGSADDSALNGLKIHCRSSAAEDPGTWWVDVYTGEWGTWKPAVTIADKYVKLANIRFEDAQGKGTDDTAWNGLSLRYETPNNGVSKAVVEGRWANVASGPMVETSLLESIETSEGKDLTTEQSSSISMTVEAGYSFAGASASVSVTGEHSRSTARSVSSTITRKQQRTITVTCTGESPTGFWVLWQWTMGQPDDDTGPGFEMNSNNYRCTSSMQAAPKCPLGMCKDNMCQDCIEVDIQGEKD